jgi:hypothetical protein
MSWPAFYAWIDASSLVVIAVALFAAMCLAAALGTVLQVLGSRGQQGAPKDGSDGQEGYVVSAVLGLLALLLGFTFTLAVDRFDARRYLVVEEANAIGTVYLRAQLLPEPHRSRTSDLLVRYTDNRIRLAQARPGPAQRQYLATSDALLTDLWAATSAAEDAIKNLPSSAVYLDSVNHLIDLDASRKAARQARVPSEVFAVLFAYLVTAAGVLGYVLKGRRGRLTASFLLALLTVSFALIVDIDRPTMGAVNEEQGPMLDLQKSLAAQPPRVFDKWRTPVAATGVP